MPCDGNFSQYINLPWVEGDLEKGIPRFTCWTLFRRVYWDKLYIELPAYDEVQPLDKGRVARTIASDLHQWTEVPRGRERLMDGVMMYRGTHIGLVTKRGQMLHLERDRFSVVEPYTRPRWETCIDGFFRYGADLTV